MSRFLWLAVPLCAAFFLIVVFALCVVVATGALAHSFYDAQCCSGDDCAPVPDGAVTEGPDGYTLPNGGLVPYGSPKIRFSPDGQYHWCHSVPINGEPFTYCLYVPGRGI